MIVHKPVVPIPLRCGWWLMMVDSTHLKKKKNMKLVSNF